MTVIRGPWPERAPMQRPAANLSRSSWWLVAAGAFAVLAAKITGVI